MKKEHKFNRKAEEYCYLRYCKAVGNKYILWWLNRHMEFGFLRDKVKK